jgi:hypothetical protein
VACVQELRQVCSTPLRSAGHRNTDCHSDPPNDSQGRALQTTGFDTRHHRSADARGRGNLRLAHATPDTHRPNCRAKPKVVHMASLARAAQPALNRRWSVSLGQ